MNCAEILYGDTEINAEQSQVTFFQLVARFILHRLTKFRVKWPNLTGHIFKTVQHFAKKLLGNDQKSIRNNILKF